MIRPTEGEWVLAKDAMRRLGLDASTWTRRFAPLVRCMGSDGMTLTPTKLYYWPDCEAVGAIWERKRNHAEMAATAPPLRHHAGRRGLS